MTKKLLFLSLALLTFVVLLTATAAAAELPFADVKAGSDYYEGVKYVYEKGLMNGTAPDRFSPKNGLTRGMIVTILHRLNGSPQPGSASFADVPADAWYAKGVAWAASNGVAGGVGDGKFAPDATLTREQLVTMLYRAAKSPVAGGDLDFPDAKKTADWAEAPMRWAVKCKLISAMKTGILGPKAVASRGLVASMLSKFGSGENVVPPGLVVTDAHAEAANADFSALETLYAGMKATYTGLHEHADTGKVMRDGKLTGSDGHYTLKQWKETILDELGYDVTAIVDHRQVQGLYSPDWDPDLFIYGTEPGTHFTSGLSPQAKDNHIHYTMLFDDRDDLMNVLQTFTEFGFRGDDPNPIYWGYKSPDFTKARFLELVDYVHSIGGTVSYAHPMGSTTDYHSYLMSDNIEDYFIGEFTNFDTINWEGPYTNYSQESYEIWERLLQAGHHIYASTIGDTHGTKRCDPSTVYTTTKKAPEAFRQVRAGNFTAGYMGIKMNVGDKPMGSVAGYKEGDTLTIEVADFFKKKSDVKPDSDYYLRVFTDKGLCAIKKIRAEETTRFAITMKDRAYYHADVFNADNGYAIAIGNPIWKK